MVATRSGRAGFLPALVEVSPGGLGGMCSPAVFCRRLQGVQFHGLSSLSALDINKLVESDMSNFMHGFMSMESAAEAYNETFRHSTAVTQLKEFLYKTLLLEIIVMQK